jgi:glycosidase
VPFIYYGEEIGLHHHEIPAVHGLDPIAALNVAAQGGDPSSLLHCYRDLLRLRRRTRALHAGSLELLDAVPRDVVGYRRSCGDGGETADVFLNFGSAPRRLPLVRRPGALLWSNLRCETRPAEDEIELAPREGVVVLSPEALGVE